MRQCSLARLDGPISTRSGDCRTFFHVQQTYTQNQQKVAVSRA